MVYITGDTHGDMSVFKNPKLRKLGEDDILIICGDFFGTAPMKKKRT